MQMTLTMERFYGVTGGLFRISLGTRRCWRWVSWSRCYGCAQACRGAFTGDPGFKRRRFVPVFRMQVGRPQIHGTPSYFECLASMQPLTAWSPGFSRSRRFEPPEGGTPNRRFMDRGTSDRLKSDGLWHGTRVSRTLKNR